MGRPHLKSWGDRPPSPPRSPALSKIIHANDNDDDVNDNEDYKFIMTTTTIMMMTININNKTTCIVP